MPVSKAQQKAVNKYMAANYDRINLTIPKGQRDIIKAHADSQGESTNAFIGRAITETMERDTGGPQEATGPGGLSLPPEALKTAQGAAEAAGETVPVFVSRAVETQAQRDALGRKMEGGERK